MDKSRAANDANNAQPSRILRNWRLLFPGKPAGHLPSFQLFGGPHAGAAQQKSFFDGRVHLFGEDFVRKYSLVFHDSHWEELLANWHIRYLLLSKSPGEKDSPDMIKDARNSGRWKTLYEDDIAILLEKDAVREME